MIYTSSVDDGGPSNCSHSPSFLVPSKGLLFDAFSQMVVFCGVAILDAPLDSLFDDSSLLVVQVAELLSVPALVSLHMHVGKTINFVFPYFIS